MAGRRAHLRIVRRTCAGWLHGKDGGVSSDLYRDPLLGLRARVADLVEQVREREEAVTDLFWSSIPRADRERFASLRDAVELSRASSHEELARAEEMLTAYVVEFDARLEALPDTERAWRELPDETADPPLPSTPWADLLTGTELGLFRRGFATMVHERDPRAEIVEGRYSCLARFRVRGAPFSIRATVEVNANGQLTEVPTSLFTSVARVAPPFVVRHETLALSLGKALGLKHEVEVGNPSFDGLFLIEGTAEAASVLLPAPVQSMLLALARFDIPTLRILPEERLATLTWRFEPVVNLLDLAVRILASVREASLQTGATFRR